MLSPEPSRLRKYQYTTFIPLALTLADFGIILILLDKARYFFSGLGVDVQDYLLLSVNIALCWTLASFIAGAYRVENMDSIRKIVLRSAASAVLYFVLILVSVGLGGEGAIPLETLLLMGLFTSGMVVTAKVFMQRVFKVLRNMSGNRKKVIIIGNTPRGKELSRYFLTTTSLPIQYLGFFDNNIPDHLEDVPFFQGNLDKVKEYCLENGVSEIYYALDQQREFFTDLVKFADEQFIFLGIVPDIDGIDYSRRIDTLLYNDSRIPVISSRKVPLQLFENHQTKRAFDIVFSSFVLFFLFIFVFPVIALAIKLSSPGPVLFKQLRPGKKNQLFWCYKFRTMRMNNDQHVQASKNDSRITRVGAFLRKTSLDELPQFYNVLIGDMSVVGPRPNLLIHLEEYPKEIKEYALRHWVTPGITGFAQVSGYRGETKETILMQKRVEHDLQYIENWSLSLDLKIIGKTVVNMVKGEDNAY